MSNKDEPFFEQTQHTQIVDFIQQDQDIITTVHSRLQKVAKYLSSFQPVPHEGDFLLTVKSGNPLFWYYMKKERIVIGRSRSADLCLDDAMISSKHCLLEFDGYDWCLTDLGSKNSTFVNSAIIAEHVCREGDVISLGCYELLFVRTTKTDD